MRGLLILGVVLLGVVRSALALNTICIVPGYGGDDGALMTGIVPLLQAQNRAVVVLNTTRYLNHQGINDPSIDQHAAALHDLLGHQLSSDGGTRCLLVGHSMGGLVARRFLATYSSVLTPSGLVPVEQVAQVVVTIGSPQRGTDVFDTLNDLSQMAQLMRPVGMVEMNSPQGSLYSPWNPLVPVISIRTYMLTLSPFANWFEAFYWDLMFHQNPGVLTDGFVPFESQWVGTELVDFFFEANHTFFVVEPGSAFYYGLIFDILQSLFP